MCIYHVVHPIDTDNKQESQESFSSYLFKINSLFLTYQSYKSSTNFICYEYNYLFNINSLRIQCEYKMADMPLIQILSPTWTLIIPPPAEHIQTNAY